MLPGAAVRAAMAVFPDCRVRVGAAAVPRRARVRAAHGRARPPRPPSPHPLRVRAVSLWSPLILIAALTIIVTTVSRRCQLRLPNSFGVTIYVICSVYSGSSAQTVPTTSVIVRVLFTNEVLNYEDMKVHRT